jgi:hypothetical protein
MRRIVLMTSDLLASWSDNLLTSAWRLFLSWSSVSARAVRGLRGEVSSAQDTFLMNRSGGKYASSDWEDCCYP